MEVKNYIALFEYVKGEKGFSVVFPDFPGCITAGDDYEETVKMAQEALALHIHGMKADGDEIPEPRTLEQIMNTWDDWMEWKEKYDFLVVPIPALPLKATKKRFNVIMDDTLIYKIDKVSKNRSEFLSEAARKMLNFC